MSKELKMEVFASKEPVKSVRLHVYEFHTSELFIYFPFLFFIFFYSLFWSLMSSKQIP